MLPHASISIVGCARPEYVIEEPRRLGRRLKFSIQVHRLPETFGENPGLLYVAPDLPGELIDSREASLFPYAFHEADVYHAPVQIPLEIDEMSLDAALDPPESRRHADVRTRGILFFAKTDEPGVDSASRYNGVRIRHHVCRWKADGPASLVSDHYLSPEHVGASEEADGLGHFSLGDQSPYAGGADPTLNAGTAYPNRNSRPPCLPHEPQEVLKISGSPVPETKVRADYDYLGPYLPHQHVPHELFGALPGLVEV